MFPRLQTPPDIVIPIPPWANTLMMYSHREAIETAVRRWGTPLPLEAYAWVRDVTSAYAQEFKKFRGGNP